MVEPRVEASLSPEETAALRAYLQRSEVRLSTVHRVASALLSGAGLMVLLPAIERDTVVDVVRSLLADDVDVRRLLLLVGTIISIALPFTALWLVLRDLTQFYFHANHVAHATGESFTPRFTLTGLRLPLGELGPASQAALDASRRQPHNVELLVPANDVARSRIDERINAYRGDDGGQRPDDLSRAEALFDLTASRERSLLDEVAKVEHGMARHVLRIQTIVLRYVKALLALLTTLLAAFAAAGVTHDRTEIGLGEEVWLAAILLVWAPLVMIAVTAPVRWLERQLRGEGATHTAVSDDRELTQVEAITLRLAVIAGIAAGATMAMLLAHSSISREMRVGGATVLVVSAVAIVAVLWRWSEGRTWRRERASRRQAAGRSTRS